MPNWIKTLVFAKEKTDELRALFRGKDAYGEEQDVTFNKVVPCPPEVYHGDLSFADKDKYNGMDWHTWNCANWGTKWDACHGEVYEDHIEFDTAWSFAYPVMREAAKQLGDYILCLYADEGIPENTGAYIFAPDGSHTEISNDTLANEAIHWGLSLDPESLFEYIEWREFEEDVEVPKELEGLLVPIWEADSEDEDEFEEDEED